MLWRWRRRGTTFSSGNDACCLPFDFALTHRLAAFDQLTDFDQVMGWLTG